MRLKRLNDSQTNHDIATRDDAGDKLACGGQISNTACLQISIPGKFQPHEAEAVWRVFDGLGIDPSALLEVAEVADGE